jgi:hypothetical protein
MEGAPGSVPNEISDEDFRHDTVHHHCQVIGPDNGAILYGRIKLSARTTKNTFQRWDALTVRINLLQAIAAHSNGLQAAVNCHQVASHSNGLQAAV